MHVLTLSCLVLIPLYASAQGGAQQPDMSVVLTGERALMVLPPRLVAAGDVYNVSTSPSGRYLVAFQEVPSERPLELGKQPPEPKAKNIVVWDSLTGGTRTLVLPKELETRTASVQWFAQSERALVQVSSWKSENEPGDPSGEPRMRLRREWHVLDPVRAELRRVFVETPGTDFGSRIVTSPVEPIAVKVHVHSQVVATGHVKSEFTLQVLTADGQLRSPVDLSRGYWLGKGSAWSPDGRTFQIEVGKTPPGGGELIPRVIQFNPTTGSYTDVAGPVPSWRAAMEVRDVTLTNETKTVEDFPAPRAVRTWWLASVAQTETPRALVAGDAVATLLPNGERFVAYLVGGALFTRQILQLPIDKYREMKEAAEHAELLSRGKQIGLAAAMYAADYDDVLQPGFTTQDLMPYAKNSAVFDGFTLVFPGGNLKDVKDLANTVLGYIEGPGGRAVVYLDSHVKWEKKG